jgi:hypothetical protein
MIDPIGPDPSDPNQPPRKVNEISARFEIPGSTSPIKPKIRFANYDSPEALMRHTPPGEPATIIRPARTLESSPAPGPKPAPTALARHTPKPTTFERAVGMAKTVLPLVGKMLPLLEGNVVSAASNLLLNRPDVDLKPLEDSIASLQADQRALTFLTSEQKRALHRLEDEFDAVKEAVQKNAAEQAELIEGVAKLAKRTSSFMRLVIILLVLSMLFTALLCVRIAYIIRF